MKPSRYYFIAAGFAAALLVATIAVYPQLPAHVPSHWNIHNEVDRYAPRWTLLVYGPATIAGVMLLFSILPWLSPKRFEVGSFQSTYLYIMVVIVAEMTYLFALILVAALYDSEWRNAPLLPINMLRAITGGFSLFIALMGNVLGKVRRNFYMGVRTPWTLASERVWNATHRFAARCFVIAGIAGFLCALANLPIWVWITVFSAGALAPVGYSLIYYKRLERGGELET
jgi:uncharacterized membrane protein